jgi:hypothetical protein
MSDEKTFTQAFNEYKDADDCISADDLRDLIFDRTERDMSAKTIRAHLRKMKARDQKTLKNARWRIDKKLAQETVEHFDKS